MAMNPAHVAWCRKLFWLIRDGGAWGVPRSGLFYQKQGDKLVLVDRMPHDPAMPISAEKLRAQQDSDHAANVEHFGAAGVTVTEGKRR